jgi:hypothetical protein
MNIKKTCALVAFATSFWFFLVESRCSGDNIPTEKELLRLIQQLGDDQFSIREKASQNLKKAGVPALNLLRKASRSEDADVRNRAKEIIENIEVANGIVAEGGTEFQIVAAHTWSAPPSGGKKTGQLSLKITNWNDEKYCFYLVDTVQVLLLNSHGKVLECKGGRDGTTRGVTFSPALAKGDSYTVSFFCPELSLDSDDKDLRLSGSDGFGGIWYYDKLSLGKYFISMKYEYRENFKKAGVSVWKGKVETRMREIVIR